MHPSPTDTRAIINSPYLFQYPFILPIAYVATAPKTFIKYHISLLHCTVLEYKYLTRINNYNN